MSLLKTLLEHTRQHVYDPQPAPLGSMGVFHCHHRQTLRAVPLWQPSIVVVLQGTKRMVSGHVDLVCEAGEMLLIPAHSEVLLENIPDAASQDYLALCLSFYPASIATFLETLGKDLQWDHQDHRVRVAVPEDILLSLLQRLQWGQWLRNAPDLLEVRQQELLALLARYGILGPLLINRHPSIAQRVEALLGMNCAHAWRISEMARQLGMSETTLRRELGREGTGFRELLEQTRLVAGLSLLQETRYSVGEVAARVGYESPSRFAARFRERFGLSPNEIKQTREKVKEQNNASV